MNNRFGILRRARVRPFDRDRAGNVACSLQGDRTAGVRPQESHGWPVEGGIQLIAGPPDSSRQRTGDVATPHSPDARAQSASSEIFGISDGDPECEPHTDLPVGEALNSRIQSTIHSPL